MVKKMEDNVCKLCISKSGNVLIILTCCTYPICKEHLDKYAESGVTVIKCQVCSQELNINSCLNTMRNREKIVDFEVKSNRKELKKNFEDFERLMNDPPFYLNKNLEELVNKINLRREELKVEITRKIDEYYMSMMDKIEESKKAVLKVFRQETELFRKDELEEIKKLINDDNKNNNETKNKILKEKIDNIFKIKKILDLKVKLKLKENTSTELDIKNVFAELTFKENSPIYLNKIECVKTLEGHTDGISSLQTLENGEIVSSSADTTIKVWDKISGECTKTLSGHSSYVSCLQVLFDTGEIVSGSSDNTIKIWDKVTGDCKKTLIGHTGYVICLRVLDSGVIVSGSSDNSIKIWDKFTGECKKTLIGHTNYVYCLQVHDNGEIVSGSRDNTIKIWH